MLVGGRWIAMWLLVGGISWGAERPTSSVTVRGRAVEIVDGDTLTVEVRVPIRIRLRDCWAKEVREPGGKEAREHLRKMVDGKACLIQIPLEGTRRLDDVFSFGRLLAWVWIDGESVDVSARMVADGFATREKRDGRATKGAEP